MSLRTFFVSRAAQHITGLRRQEKARARAEAERRKTGAMHTIDYYHQADDPYSHLMVQVLPRLVERYEIRIQVHLVSPPPDWAAPDRDRLIDYSRRDAAVLARKAGLDFDDPGHQPAPTQVEQAEAALAALIDAKQAVGRAAAVSAALWREDAPTTPAADPNRVQAIKAEGDTKRDAGDHYLGAMLHYGGEWYWGLDRLHHLETRLTELGARQASAPADPIFPPPPVPAQPGEEKGGEPPVAPVQAGTEVHAYLSFRSPYSYLAAVALRDLAEHHGAVIRPRFVLPMVMRGLQVPATKGRYIVMDVAREARRLGIPFGKIADPVGEPVERGYAVMPYAIAEGRDMAFSLSFLTGVWADGIDAGSQSGLQQIVERAGLDWSVAKGEIGTDGWRAIEAANQAELLDLGIWGVPSFRVGAVSAWGQDRLWVMDAALEALKPHEAADENAVQL
ncbi:MAG: DsbA family protein [Pseudomonadota bacterium]